MELKKYKSYSTEQEAIIDSLKLKGAGIKYEIVKIDGGPYPSMTQLYGYDLMIDGMDEEHVKSILSNSELSVKKESKEEMNDDKPDYKWYMYGGLVIGILIGIVALWTYQKLRFYTDGNVKYKYKGRFVSEVKIDRNKDGKDDFWTYYDMYGAIRGKSDHNYDGKIDYWWKKTGIGESRAQYDVDYNGIPDFTEIFEKDIIAKIVYHPNNESNIIRSAVYKNGLIFCDSLDTDGDGHFDIVRHYDSLAQVIEEYAIK